MIQGAKKAILEVKIFTT